MQTMNFIYSIVDQYFLHYISLRTSDCGKKIVKANKDKTKRFKPRDFCYISLLLNNLDFCLLTPILCLVMLSVLLLLHYIIIIILFMIIIK